ncbi:amino acid ABC transporter ATP-binding protein [Candidatus Chromulinivorax destructor]|uniref:Glutamine ABC transporter ATP-binding protein n=1 Tax=Candidatus Chromulinivorax destructor TaxID=2066483 RepID=A0A345ZBY7_9BACT|nr:amino acid ABC transporter ATP-binding protein [Candidatus Chromulinivorax destructor]AXK60804.1 glutamine ABC transporter ATP-binding protein [Candidatus Chromulinivorax destructor]
MLSIKNLSKHYHEKTILDDVSFDVQAGEVVVLLGKSGVGKSTILRILTGLETKDSGSIIFDGQPLVTQKVGMVFQDFNLFPHLTIEQNIMLPLQKVAGKTEQEAQNIADQLLAKYELSAQAQLYPHGLSGGQKQRVAFARTLAMQPQLICCDEPTSALDPLLTSKIGQEINDLALQGLTVIVATHDTELIKQIKSTIYLMKSGKIIEKATSQGLIDNPDQFPFIKNFTQGGTFDTTNN